MKNFYVTSPIYYVNDVPHIGHAYTNIICDVIARFHRLKGEGVFFATGTDEHGQKVAKTAAGQNIDPQGFTDKVSITFRDLFDKLNISYSDFIRTTEERHKKGAIHMWQKLKNAGAIYLDKYAGWYAVRDEAFYQESELVDGKAPTGAAVEWVEEPSYFFNLSKWQEPLLKFYKDNPDFIWPESRRNEVIKFVESGLKDLSISRTSFTWGVHIPDDSAHVMYVWLDALTNYLTILGYPEQTDNYKSFWPANIHVVGKDILRFHAVYWPAFLMAAGLPLPKQVVAHGWWLNEGEKISKSLGNVINPYDLLEKYGLDELRYYLLREVPFGQDGNFTHDSMVQRVNSELANNIGNLSQRVLKFVAKECESKVPNINISYDSITLLAKAMEISKSYQDLFEAHRFNLAIDKIIELANHANLFVDEMAPWHLKNDDRAKMEEVLYILMETLRYIGIMLLPIVPETAGKLLAQLSLNVEECNFSNLNSKNRLMSGTILPPPSILFSRIE